MCELYFANSKEAVHSFKILQPLHSNAIQVISTVYPRDRTAIAKAKQMIIDHPTLAEAISRAELDPKFLAREFLSHILFEIYLENGIKGSIEYIYENCKDETNFQLLVFSVLINRLNALAHSPYPVLLYEQSWNILLHEHAKIISLPEKDQTSEQIDSFEIEHFKYKLFETLLMPIFGKCDSKEKANIAARFLSDKQKEIRALKDECEHIAREVILLPTKDKQVQQDVLNALIRHRITEPLSILLEKPRQDILAFLRDVFLDSSVIAGLMSIFYGFDAGNLATAFTSAIIATGTRLALSYRAGNRVQAPKLLIEGMRRNRMSYLQFQEHLNSINMAQLKFQRS
jgi:hypothetical protein